MSNPTMSSARRYRASALRVMAILEKAAGAIDAIIDKDIDLWVDPGNDKKLRPSGSAIKDGLDTAIEGCRDGLAAADLAIRVEEGTL